MFFQAGRNERPRWSGNGNAAGQQRAGGGIPEIVLPGIFGRSAVLGGFNASTRSINTVDAHPKEKAKMAYEATVCILLFLLLLFK